MSDIQGIIFYDRSGTIQRVWEPYKQYEWAALIEKKMGRDFLALLKKHNVKFTEDGGTGANT